MQRPIAAALVLLLCACSGPAASGTPTAGPVVQPSSEASLLPSPSALPSAGALPTTAPTTIPTGEPIGSFQVFPPGAAVEVLVKELNVRKNPSTSAKRLATRARGDLLIISPTDQLSFGWGPVRADGYTWYPIFYPGVVDANGHLPALPMSPLAYDDVPVSGWIATDNGRDPFVAAVEPRCPATVDLANVSGMLPAERLACFGAPFVLEGTYGCGGCGGVVAGIFKPFWLASPQEFGFLSVDASVRLGPLALRFPPAGPDAPPAGSIIRVTVHVDDPRSTKCQMAELDAAEQPVPIASATALLYCRERIVVESFEITGTDPEFPLG